MTDKKTNSTWLDRYKDVGKWKKVNVKYLLLLLFLGIFFMIVSNVFTESGDDESMLPVSGLETENKSEKQEPEAEPVFKSSGSDGPLSMGDYEALYEAQLKKALEQMMGVSEVTVFVNLAETERQVYQTNINSKEQTTDETDREGGKRQVQDVTKDEQVVIIRSGDKEEPLIQRVEKPDVKGVLIVAKGVDNIQVKTSVVEAVSRALDVPSHRVSVMPKKNEGEL
ncbi:MULTISPECIES: stage III sporulation protein AG [Alteribacter]|uniref:Stage III sporulation protein AG n=1 Tax=Alteribacter keqinensis TaxID=2483800 RepID=A0A3M7TTK9_9BACI|nr:MULTISPECIES: stage III sporulation protein AG [Alteribacter]MBM7097288.1 stage III sporulation protein AG [Alteribacter salitolerans]RNA68976.1 stage III sporulation protein AG [Alteribacter keqinensis]